MVCVSPACGRAQVTTLPVPRGAGRSPVLVLWALESLSPCLLQQTCRSRGSRAFMTTLSWWPGWMLHSSAASCHMCLPSAPLTCHPETLRCVQPRRHCPSPQVKWTTSFQSLDRLPLFGTSQGKCSARVLWPSRSCAEEQLLLPLTILL